MTTITAVVSAKMRTVTAHNDNNYGGIGGVEGDYGFFYDANRLYSDVLGSAFFGWCLLLILFSCSAILL